MAVTPPTPERQAQIDAYVDYVIHRNDPAPKPVKPKKKKPKYIPAMVSENNPNPSKSDRAGQRAAESVAQTVIGSLRKPFAHITSHGADVVDSIQNGRWQSGNSIKGLLGYTSSPLKAGGGLVSPNEPNTYDNPKYAEAYDTQQGAGTYYNDWLQEHDPKHKIPFVDNWAVKKTVGLGGDLLFDPVTYFIPGSSVMQGAGRKVGSRFVEAAVGAAGREMVAAEGQGLIARAGQVGMELAGADLTTLTDDVIRKSIADNELARKALYDTLEAQTRSRALQIATDIGTKGKGIVTDADVAYFFPGEQAGLAWRAPMTGPMGRKVGRLLGADIKELKFPVLSKNTTNPIVKAVGAGPRAFGRSKVGDAFGNFFGGQYAPMIRAGFHSGVPDEVYRALAVDMGASANRIGESVGMRMGHAAYPEMTKAFSQGAEVSTPPTFAQVVGFLLRKEFKGLGTAGEDALVGVVESTDDALIDSTKGARPLADFFKNAYNAAESVGIKMGKASSYISRLLKKEVYDDLLREAQLRAEEAVPRDGTGGLETSLDGVARDPRVSIHHSRVTAAMIGLPEDATPAEVRAALTRYYAAKYPDGIFETSLRKIIANYVRQSDQAWGRQRMLDTLLGWGVAAKEEDVAIILEKMHQGNKGGAGRYFLDLLNKSKFPQYRQNKILREFIKLSDEAERINQQTAVANAQFPSGGAGPTTPNVPPASPAPTTQWGTAKTVEQYEQEVDDLINGAGSSNDPNTGGWDDDPYGPLGGTLTDSGQQRPRSGGGDKPRGIGRPIGDKPRIVTLGSDDMRLNMDGGDNGLPPVGGEGGGDPFGPGRPRKGRQTSPGGRAGKGPVRSGRSLGGGDAESGQAMGKFAEQQSREESAFANRFDNITNRRTEHTVGKAIYDELGPEKSKVIADAAHDPKLRSDTYKKIGTFRWLSLVEEHALYDLLPEEWLKVVSNELEVADLMRKWQVDSFFGEDPSTVDSYLIEVTNRWRAWQDDGDQKAGEIFTQGAPRPPSRDVSPPDFGDDGPFMRGDGQGIDALNRDTRPPNFDGEGLGKVQRGIENEGRPQNPARRKTYPPGRTHPEPTNAGARGSGETEAEYLQRVAETRPDNLVLDASGYPIKQTKPVATGPAEAAAAAEATAKDAATDPMLRAVRNRTRHGWARSSESLLVSSERSRFVDTIRDRVTRELRTGKRDTLTPESIQEMWDEVNRLGRVLKGVRSNIEDAPRGNRRLLTKLREARKAVEEDILWVKKGLHGSVEPEPPTGSTYRTAAQDAASEGKMAQWYLDNPDGLQAYHDAVASDGVTPDAGRLPSDQTYDSLNPRTGQQGEPKTVAQRKAAAVKKIKNLEDYLYKGSGLNKQGVQTMKPLDDIVRAKDDEAVAAISKVLGLTKDMGVKADVMAVRPSRLQQLEFQLKAVPEHNIATRTLLQSEIDRVRAAFIAEHGDAIVSPYNAKTVRVLNIIRRMREIARDIKYNVDFPTGTETAQKVGMRPGLDTPLNKVMVPDRTTAFDVSGMQANLLKLKRQLAAEMGGLDKMKELGQAFDFTAEGTWGQLTANLEHNKRILDMWRSELDRGNAAGGTFLGDTSLIESPYIEAQKARQRAKLFGTRPQDPNSAAGMAESRTSSFTEETLTGQRDEERFARTLGSNDSGSFGESGSAEEMVDNLFQDQIKSETDPDMVPDYENKSKLDSENALDDATTKEAKSREYDQDKSLGGKPYTVSDDFELNDMDNLHMLIEELRYQDLGDLSAKYSSQNRVPARSPRSDTKLGRMFTKSEKMRGAHLTSVPGGGEYFDSPRLFRKGEPNFPPLTQTQVETLFDGRVPEGWISTRQVYAREPGSMAISSTLIGEVPDPIHMRILEIADAWRAKMQIADDITTTDYWHLSSGGRDYRILSQELDDTPSISKFVRSEKEQKEYTSAMTTWKNRRIETVWIDEDFNVVKGPDDASAVGQVRQVEQTAWRFKPDAKDDYQWQYLHGKPKAGKSAYRPIVVTRTEEEKVVHAFVEEQLLAATEPRSAEVIRPFEDSTTMVGKAGPRQINPNVEPPVRTLEEFKQTLQVKMDDIRDRMLDIAAKREARIAAKAADDTVASAVGTRRSEWMTSTSSVDDINKETLTSLRKLQQQYADLEAVHSSSTLEKTWTDVTERLKYRDTSLELPTSTNAEGRNVTFKQRKVLEAEQKIILQEHLEAVTAAETKLENIKEHYKSYSKAQLKEAEDALAHARRRLIVVQESGGQMLADMPELQIKAEKGFQSETAVQDAVEMANGDPLVLQDVLDTANALLVKTQNKLDGFMRYMRDGHPVKPKDIRDVEAAIANIKGGIGTTEKALEIVKNPTAAASGKVRPPSIDTGPRTAEGATESIMMKYGMGVDERNANVVSENTLDAMESGVRTSTTRTDQDSMQAINRLRPDDTVRFNGNGKSLELPVEARYKFKYDGKRVKTFDMDTGVQTNESFDEFIGPWSEREGWTPARGKRFFDEWLAARGRPLDGGGRAVEGRILINGSKDARIIDYPDVSSKVAATTDTGAVVGREAHGWRTGKRVTKPVSENNKAQILEISTKSTSPLGRDLSALNLKLDGVKVEDIYQAAKRGPNGELLGKGKNPDYFILDGVRHEGGDNQAVYDLIYRKALKQYVEANPGAVAELEKYAAYSDQFVKPDAHPNAASQAKSVSDFMAERVAKDVPSVGGMKHPETVLSGPDLWPAHTASKDAYGVIPTNVMLRADGTAVMGAGLAKQAADRFPGLEARYGAFLADAKANGTTTTMVDKASRLVLVATKDDWRNPSSIGQVKTALDELSQLDEKLLIPALGTGKGGVDKAIVAAEMASRGIKPSPTFPKGIDKETGAASLDFLTLGLGGPVKKLAKAFGKFTEKHTLETTMLGPPTPEMAVDEYNTILSTLDFGVSPRDPNMSDPFAGELELADKRLVSLQKQQKNHLRQETQAANKSMAYKAWIKQQLRDPNISAAEHQRLTDRLAEIDVYRAKARGKFSRASAHRAERIRSITEVKTIMEDAKPAIEAARDNPISLKAIEIQKTGLLTQNAWDRRYPTSDPREVFQKMMGLTSQQLDQRFSALTEPMVKAAQDFHGGAALSKQSRKALYGAVDLQQSQRIITHPDIAAVFNSLEKMREPGALTTVLKRYDQFQLWWKGVALSSPGFHARNAMGGIFNNFLANSEPGAVNRFWKQHQKYIKGELSFEDAKKMQVLLRDVGGGQYSHVELGTGAANKFSLNPFSKDFAYLKGNAAVGNKIEFYLRGGLYWDRLEKGLGPNVAHADVVRFHFDYNDLSNFEEKVVKRVMPFYVWSRRNFPLQLEMMMRNPGKYRLYNQTRMALMDGKDKNSLVHKYITNTMWGSPLPLHIGKEQIFGVPDLPFTRTMSQNMPSFDNFKAKDPKTWLSTLDPYMQQVAAPLRVPIELLANRQFFNGRPRSFDDTSKTQGSDLGRLLKPLQQRVGKTRLDYIIGQAVPYAETIRKLVGSEKKFQDRRATSWLAYMGIPLRANSKADQQMEAMRISKEDERRRVEATKDGAMSTSWASIKNGSFGTTDERPKSDKERTVAEAQAAGKLYRIESMKKRLLAEHSNVANILKMWGDGSGLVRMKNGDLKKLKLDFSYDGVKVIKVVDGDTIVVDNNGKSETVRLLGVDTGETKHKGVDKPATYWGPEAAAYTRSSLKGRYVSLEDDEVKTDIYGRRLSHVSIDGRSFNNRLLKQGYARSLIIPPNNAYNKRMLRKELEAIKAKRGLWAKATFTDVVAP